MIKRTECYDTVIVLKKSILIITKSGSTALSKLAWQTRKVKTRKMLRDGQRMSLSYFQKSQLIRKITLLFFWRNWQLEVSQEWSIGAYQHTFEMEMDKVISRENNTDQFKENATKFKCINYFNNINASSFIKKCMI